ncbi:Hypothetical predicted protein [Olea europaea subsp. europaea]|uniref:Uncharacterized protein n=1 Tax=Olea europaea subsp. europaea TaxID=158383 RepID=A0A8S0SZQ1_OLEEU|nr:Hypothetical predicted protein [Olea europaea subsp. europaea]
MTEFQCTNKELTVQLKDLKSQLLDLKRDRSSQIDHLIRVQGEIRLDMTEIRSSMTFLSDSAIVLISSMMDAIVVKATEKSEVHSVGDAPRQEKVFDKLKEELRGQMTEFQCTNKELTMQLKDLKSQLLDLKRDRSSQIDHLIHVQGEIRLDMTEIRSSMTFLSDSVIILISSMMDAIVVKATEKSEVHSVGDAPQQEKVTIIQQNIDRKGKDKMDPANEIEYSSFPPTPSFDLGVASTSIISNKVDAIIAGVVKDCEIEE